MSNAKIIVVTGGKGLLGSAIASEIGASGHTALVADIDVDNDSTTGSYLCDITDEHSVQHCIDSIIADHGRIDGWVNNAYPRTADWGLDLEQIPFDSWRKNVDMHLNGYFLCSQKVLAVMAKQQTGALVNLASIYGSLGPDFSVYKDTNTTMPAAYAAIKGGIINLTRYLAAYYGPRGVRVNALSPGGIWDHQPEAFVDSYSKKVPLRRMGNPDDIAPVAMFLLSDEARYITGHNLVVDGGWSIV